jgi:alpha-ketoglutarate-dependent taurine dioxygenase
MEVIPSTAAAGALHLAINDYRLPQRRLLYRTTIEGGVPV